MNELLARLNKIISLKEVENVFVDFTDVVEDTTISVNKDKIVTVRPRADVHTYELKNVTQIVC